MTKVAGRYSDIADKARRVEELQAQLANAQDELKAAFDLVTKSGEGTARKSSKGKPGRKPGRKPAKNKTATAGKKNQLTLPKLIPTLLEKEPEGITPEDLTKKILSTGYDTSAKDFHSVVYQTLRKLVRKNEGACEIEVEEGSDPKYTHPQHV